MATARVLALRFHVGERSTPARLSAVKSLHVGAERDLDALIQAHRVLLGEILDQQLVDIGAGISASNKVETRRLNSGRLEKLKDALKSLRYADEMVRDLLTGE